MTANIEIDARAESTLRLLLSMRPQEFVSTRRGFEDVHGLEKSLSGGIIRTVADAFRNWTDERDEMWKALDGECRISCGIRAITLTQFNIAFRKLNTDSISDEMISKMFTSFPIESICEIKNGKRHGKWICVGITDKVMDEWQSKEAIVWMNMNPDWWLEVSESFIVG